jgi:Domain of unknown function (DUF4375)
MRYEIVDICVDEGAIAADPWVALVPVWWTATIYDGPEQYELSLMPFSRSQRLLFAVVWYRNEVNNGGHQQFFSNSTGIVWRDALGALDAMELPNLSSILAEAATRLGGSPSLDRAERMEQLDTFAPNFRDLDRRFYEAEKKLNLDDQIAKFIRTRPAGFFFVGKIRRAVLPGR